MEHNPPSMISSCVLVTDSLIYSSLCDVPAAVQPDVDDPPAEILVPGHHVHSVAELCRTENTEQLLQQGTSCHTEPEA